MFATKVTRIAVLSCALVCALAGAAAPPQLTLTKSGGEVRGLTPGADSIWLVVKVGEFSGMPMRSRIVRVVADEDRDGIAILETAPGISSVWVVVDFQTGEFAIASPGEAPPTELRSQGNGWGEGAASSDFDALEVDSLLVRPGRAAWVSYAEADGRGDADPGPANLRIRLGDMTKIHGSEKKTPDVALPKDVFVAIDRVHLRTFVRSAQERGQ